MRKILVIAILCVSSGAFAKVCEDSDKGLIPETAGKIVYSLGDDNCLGDSCYSQMIKEFDRCLDSQKLLEFACQNGEVLEKEILCSAGQVCRKGACVKK